MAASMKREAPIQETYLNFREPQSANCSEVYARDVDRSITSSSARSHNGHDLYITVLQLGDEGDTQHHLVRMDEEWSTDIYETQSSSPQQPRSAWDESIYFPHERT